MRHSAWVKCISASTASARVSSSMYYVTYVLGGWGEAKATGPCGSVTLGIA